MTNILRKEGFPEFNKWINKNPKFDARDGWAYTDIDGFWMNWKTGHRMLIEVKNFTDEVRTYQRINFQGLDTLLRNHAHEIGWTYGGYYVIYLSEGDPTKGEISIQHISSITKNTVTLEQLEDLMSFKEIGVFKPIVRKYN